MSNLQMIAVFNMASVRLDFYPGDCVVNRHEHAYDGENFVSARVTEPGGGEAILPTFHLEDDECMRALELLGIGDPEEFGYRDTWMPIRFTLTKLGTPKAVQEVGEGGYFK